jgi:hypothetical protein
MAQITIEVPDSLAEQLAPVRYRLPEVLARWLDQPPPLLSEVYRYVLEFLASNPSPQDVVNFKPTPAMQERISELLEKNRAGQLTPTESSELDEYGYVNRLISLLKARTLKDLTTAS